MWQQIVVPVAVFTGLVLALAALVLVARRQLEPSGPVPIELNGKRRITVEAGGRLLFRLAEQGILLPAACGGRGTCGQCRVTVRRGGGPPSPTELGLLGAAATASGLRLACMLRVREPLAIDLPAGILEARRFTAVVESSRQLATFIRELVLRPEDGEPLEFEAGDYVVVEAPPHRVRFAEFDIPDAWRSSWREHGFLELESVVTEPTTRAYSLANPPERSDRIELVVRIATPPATAPAGTPPGKVSSYIFSLAPGDEVAIQGPYGEFHASDSNREMVLIAGGVGIAPVRSIILDQLARGTGRRMTFWYGAQTADDLCYAEELERAAAAHANFEFHAALSSPPADSDWTGPTGFIHTVVYDNFLGQHPAPDSLEYYLCGPPVMSAAVIHMLEELGVPREQIFFDDFGT